jgi:hypothetical protein
VSQPLPVLAAVSGTLMAVVLLGRELRFGFAWRLALVTAIALGAAFAAPVPAAVQGVIAAALFAAGAFAARLVPEEAAHLVGSPTARA